MPYSMSTTSQPYCYDGGDDDYDGTRSYFGGPRTSARMAPNYSAARTGSIMQYMNPTDTTMLSGVGGGLFHTHLANNFVRAGIAGAAASGAYSIGSRMAGGDYGL